MKELSLEEMAKLKAGPPDELERATYKAPLPHRSVSVGFSSYEPERGRVLVMGGRRHGRSSMPYVLGALMAAGYAPPVEAKRPRLARPYDELPPAPRDVIAVDSTGVAYTERDREKLEAAAAKRARKAKRFAR